MASAPLDRTVVVTGDDGKITRLPLSGLRASSFVVLVGEPGIGKSSALAFEATAEGGHVLTCRELVNDPALAAGQSTGYVDALDEYRSSGDGKDKVLQLSKVLRDSGISRWRLTCRAEDWHKQSDINALRAAASGIEIVVAHLQPLDEDEAIAVLRHLGEDDPQAFMANARARGAAAFLESPLSLALLSAALRRAAGTWPGSRLELFAQATAELAAESDEGRSHDRRPAAEVLRLVAGEMCSYLLLSGAKALWRSNARSANPADVVSVRDLPLDQTVAESSLDTALFRGDDNTFLPMHRSVAEYLAGECLARLVVGAGGRPAFPLSRVLALLCGADGNAPSELRGLFAWLAAHLSKLGDEGGAGQLIEKDAATVLAYGDAAAFSTAGRKSLLFNLDRDDPFFRASQDRALAVGGLAGEDLAQDFRRILDRTDDGGHLVLTVLIALEEGAPVRSLHTYMREIALSEARPFWQRSRAARIWANGEPNPPAALRQLLADIAMLPKTRLNVALQAGLAGELPAELFGSADIRSLLHDVDEFGQRVGDRGDDEESSLISLTGLQLSFEDSPRLDMFDVPFAAAGERGRCFETEHFLERALASCISHSPYASAERIWSWIEASREHLWEPLASDPAEALTRWIELDPTKRETELFWAIVDRADRSDGPYLATNTYVSVSRRHVSNAIFESILHHATAATGASEQIWFLMLARAIARQMNVGPQAFWSLLSELERLGDPGGLIAGLIADPIEDFRLEHAQRRAKDAEQAALSRADNIAQLSPRVPLLSVGAETELGALAWGAELYDASGRKSSDPLARLVERTNSEIATAIAEGAIAFVTAGGPKLSVDELARVERNGQHYKSEKIVFMGLHRALSTGREASVRDAHLQISLIALRTAFFSDDKPPSISGWAVDQLARDPIAGTDLLVRYWKQLVKLGSDRLDHAWHLFRSEPRELIAHCARRLLREVVLPAQAMREVLEFAARSLRADEFLAIVREISPRYTAEVPQRPLLDYTLLMLNPEQESGALSSERISAAMLAPPDDLAARLKDVCPNCPMVDEMTIRALGPANPPNPRDWMSGRTPSSVVRMSISDLATSVLDESGGRLEYLFGAADLGAWAADLKHGLAEFRRLRRDRTFSPPSAYQIRTALEAGRPANSADLFAVIKEELGRYRRTIRTGDDMPWKRYWNTNSVGKPTTPQVENEDRDRLLELLKLRFERYGIVAAAPETRRRDNTRADILLLSYLGQNVPIEAKRHNNSELWTAPDNQLRGYTSDQGATGYGVYLVFWFGTEFPVPRHPRGLAGPRTWEDLESMLIADLPSDMAKTTAVVVLDVSSRAPT
ncbi:hypothetical protein FJ987_02800 [Mesorhizobium sp. CU2]|uniref:hypothetical protein n=1 Tax=unclassified Mesorhizobium TaxID=325217 RepID=UPI0011293C30|nr:MULTISPECIES: hypothetical protein [unclassified Mesorhizobium]TPN84167.1 hypothetical protein FJ988_11105 [Mesorhizobium sp. CU3]TPO21127.1 hypothetical protein FJ987_02800 [Mesorhizobium sp. CU2]